MAFVTECEIFVGQPTPTGFDCFIELGTCIFTSVAIQYFSFHAVGKYSAHAHTSTPFAFSTMVSCHCCPHRRQVSKRRRISRLVNTVPFTTILMLVICYSARSMLCPVILNQQRSQFMPATPVAPSTISGRDFCSTTPSSTTCTTLAVWSYSGTYCTDCNSTVLMPPPPPHYAAPDSPFGIAPTRTIPAGS